MRKYIGLSLGLLVALAAQAQDYPMTASLRGASVSQALDLYAGLTGKQLVVEAAVTNQSKVVTLDINPPVPKKEVIKRLESALRKQADVAIKPLDDRRVSVKLDKK